MLDSYTRWAYIDTSCEELLNRVVSAVELYEEATSQKILSKGNSAVERLYFSSNDVLAVPFIRHYIGAAKMLAVQLFIAQPGRDRLQLRGLEAMNKVMPGVVNDEAIATLRAKVKAHDAGASG